MYNVYVTDKLNIHMYNVHDFMYMYNVLHVHITVHENYPCLCR